MIQIVFAFLFYFALVSSLWASNVCAICGKPIFGPIYTMTDEYTGDKFLVCSNCLMLPRCYICGRPVDDDGVTLPDGRHLCARDAKLVVLDTNEALQMCADVKDDLEHLFARFATFPTNVDVAVIDRITEASLLHENGNDFESPNLLGCIQAVTNDFDERRYSMDLMSGLPPAELKATCAHEYSHAWVGDNVPRARHKHLARDAEEGFCEMVAYLLMDSQHQEAQKEFILRNHYTRGQVQLFIAAEQRFGFDQILEWMKYGVATRLHADKPDELRDIDSIAANAFPTSIEKIKSNNVDSTNQFTNATPVITTHTVVVAKSATLKLQGIFWSNHPAAIINGRTFGIGDSNEISFGPTNLTICCLEIEKNSVRIRVMPFGNEQQLSLPLH
jgi:hypothetical protein